MDAGLRRRVGTALAAAGLMAGAMCASSLGDDEPGRLGRIFRLGSSGRSAGTASTSANSASGSATNTAPPMPAVSSYSTPGAGGSGTRLVPQARNSRAATEADPLVTRVSVCRAEDGKQFCGFMQVFADGTVLDSEGIHKVGADLLRPIALAIQSGELARLKGHCGGPAADYIEQNHVVVYDRNLGRLRANSFSYSGNPQGCEPTVRQLNAAIDAIQAKLSGPPVTVPAAPSPTASRPGPTYGSAPIGLTPGR